jgi:RHS repeat-associated protein
MRLRRECDAAGNVLSETQYLYDGNLVVQERDSNSVPLVTYTRGLDMSGSLQGAGGIGGLLARTDHLQSNAALKTVFYHADGNGNVTALMDGQENVVGRYLYGPYGRLVGQWGTMASVNTVQFSSMLQYHGIVFYLRRAYLPEFSRWATQDPIGEAGGVDLYAFVGNNPVGLTDPWGLQAQVSETDLEREYEFEGEITREVRDGLRRNRVPTHAELFNSRMEREIAERAMVVRGLNPNLTYIGPPAAEMSEPPAPRPGETPCNPRPTVDLGNNLVQNGVPSAAVSPQPVQQSGGGAGRIEAGFIVTGGGTVVHASQAGMRESLEGAGFVGTPTRSPGVAYQLSGDLTVRAMEPSGPNTWRSSFNNESGTRVTPEGNIPQPPRGLTTAERAEWLNERTHISQRP